MSVAGRTLQVGPCGAGGWRRGGLHRGSPRRHSPATCGAPSPITGRARTSRNARMPSGPASISACCPLACPRAERRSRQAGGYGADALWVDGAMLGHAKNWDTRAGAESGAVQSCQKGGHAGCKAIYSDRNRCVALAWSKAGRMTPQGSWFVAGAQVGSAAKADALSACTQAGFKDCFVRSFSCSGQHGKCFLGGSQIRKTARYSVGNSPAIFIGGGEPWLMRYCWRTSCKVLRDFFLGKFPQLFCLPSRHVGHTNVGTGKAPTASLRLC